MPVLHAFRSFRLGQRLWATALAVALGGCSVAARADNLLQVFAQAQQHNPRLHAALADYRAALDRVPLARSRLLPQITAAAGFSDNAEHGSGNPLLQQFHMPSSWDYTARDVNLTASLAVYHPADRVGTEQAELAARLAYTQWLHAQQTLLVEVASAYFDVLAAQDSVVTLQQQSAAISQQLEAAKASFAAGNGTVVDQRDAQARSDLVRAQLLAARNQVELARAALEQLSGSAPGQLAGLRAGATLPAPTATLERWTHQAETDNLGVTAARMAVELARLQLRKNRSEGLPSVDAYARVDRLSSSGGGAQFPFGNRSELASVGVELRVPIFTGYAVSSRVDEAADLLDKAQADLDAARLAATQQTRVAYLGLVTARAQVKALDAAVSSSRSALDANRTGYAVGMRVNVDVLNAIAQWFDTRRLAERARYDLLLDALRLRLASGELGSPDLGAINAQLQGG